MYVVTKRIEIAGAHKLDLPYDSSCSKLHGHNWIIEVTVSAEWLDRNGMVVDFTVISEIVKRLDHCSLSDVICPNCHTHAVTGFLPEGLNPTAENIAKWIADEITEEFDGKDIIPKVTKVTVQESGGNTACYTP